MTFKIPLEACPLLTLPCSHPVHPPGDPDHSTECLLSSFSLPSPSSLEGIRGHFCYAVSFVLETKLLRDTQLSLPRQPAPPGRAGSLLRPPSHCQSGSRCVCSPRKVLAVQSHGRQGNASVSGSSQAGSL